MRMEQQSQKVQVFHTLNEFKAHRLNRTEQCKLENTKNCIVRERTLFEKDFRLRERRLKARKDEIARITSGEVLRPRSYVGTFSVCSRVTSRSPACKSARVSRKEDTPDPVTFEASKRRRRSSSSVYRDASQSIFQTDAQILKPPTPTMYIAIPMRMHSNTLNLLVPGNGVSVNTSQACCRYPSKENMDAKSDSTAKLKRPETRGGPTHRTMLSEAYYSGSPTYYSGSPSRGNSSWSRRRPPSSADIQEKVAVFVREQEEYNKENPVNEEVFVQCETFRLQSANKMHYSGARFLSRREAMVAEVLAKLGLEDRLQPQQFPVLY